MEKRNKMETEKIPKLLVVMGLPVVISMVLQAVYNIVDSAFVSNMATGGEEALGALALAFPVQMLMVAIAIGTGVGVNALLAKSTGEGDSDKAARVAGNGFFLAAVIYVIFVLFGFFGIEPYLNSQSDNAELVSLATEYLRPCCIFSFGIVAFSVLEKILQATGKTVCSTVAQITGAITNIVLDPIMIYGLCGFPELGVRGAAIATVIGQIASAVVALVLHLTQNKTVRVKLRDLVPRGNIIKGIYAIGLPAIIAQALTSLMTYALNLILLAVGERAVTAYGLYYKIQQFLLFAAFGIRDVVTPVAAYAYGAGNPNRVKETNRWGVIYTVGVMAVCVAVLEIFAHPFARLFGLGGETEALTVIIIRVVSPSCIFAGLNVALQGTMQALCRGGESLTVSVLRQIALILPPAILLAKFAPAYVWWSFLFAEAVTAAVAVLLTAKSLKKLTSVAKLAGTLPENG